MTGHDSFTRLLEAQRAANQRSPGMHVEEEIIRAREEHYLIETLQWEKAYDQRADARKLEYEADLFKASVDVLFTPAHLR